MPGAQEPPEAVKLVLDEVAELQETNFVAHGDIYSCRMAIQGLYGGTQGEFIEVHHNQLSNAITIHVGIKQVEQCATYFQIAMAAARPQGKTKAEEHIAHASSE